MLPQNNAQPAALRGVPSCFKRFGQFYIIRSYDKQVRRTLIRHPELFSRLVLQCNSCRRHMLPRPRTQDNLNVTDMVQWTLASQAAFGRPQTHNPSCLVNELRLPGHEDILIYSETCLTLPCGHLLCKGCLAMIGNTLRPGVPFREVDYLAMSLVTDTSDESMSLEDSIAEQEIEWLINNYRVVCSELEGQAPDVITRAPSHLVPAPCPGNCGFPFDSRQCLPDCPAIMTTIQFPSDIQELRQTPPIVGMNVSILPGEMNRRQAQNEGKIMVADMCHRCRLIRYICWVMFRKNMCTPLTERITACIVTDPSVHASYESRLDFAELASLGRTVTRLYHDQVKSTPWNAPLAGKVSPDLRIVFRTPLHQCICTRSAESFETDTSSCSLFNPWIYGEYATSRLQDSQNDHHLNDIVQAIPPLWHQLQAAYRERDAQTVLSGDSLNSDESSDEIEGLDEQAVVEMEQMNAEVRQSFELAQQRCERMGESQDPGESDSDNSDDSDRTMID